MLPKRWLIAPKLPSEQLNQFEQMSPVLAQVLFNRGFETPQDAYRFLYTKTDDSTSKPFAMRGMQKAVGRIRQAIKRQESIVIYGDFDADGVTSTTLLVQALRKLTAKVRPYIPHRVDEGYGLNVDALTKLAKQGVKLVITVDCGIRSVEEVEAGNLAGLDIIITDHHSIGPEIPNAYAVINPKLEPEDPMMLAGVGVAYMLAQALFTAAQVNSRNNGTSDEFTPEVLLDLVAIGTVADLMPLNKLENRTLVKRGLEVLNRARRPGIRALLDVIGVEMGNVTTQSIGFGLGPRINAAGRLDSAMIAYKLLASTTIDDARKWAEELQALNVERQDVTRKAQETIKERLVDHDADLPLIFASDSSFEPGIVGLVAGRLAEEYFRPAIVMEEGESESRASCRSIPQFDITSALDQCADLLVRHGGHALAAGFTVNNDNIPALRDRLMSMAQDALTGQKLTPTLEVDTEVDIHRLDFDLVKELELLEPTGHSNGAPVFMTRNVHVAECRTVGHENRHLKLKISRASQRPLDAIGFGLGDWSDNLPDRIDIAYQLEINEWQGRKSLQANLQDVRPVTDE